VWERDRIAVPDKSDEQSEKWLEGKGVKVKAPSRRVLPQRKG
jgi:hypothetical protein